MVDGRRHIGWLVALVALVLLTTGCSRGEDTPSADSTDGLRLDVVEQAWTEQTLNVTRSGETLEGLRAVADPAHPADGEGFGIYCSELSISNTQVTWDNANGKWQIGGDYNTYWRRNQSGNLNIYAYAPYKISPYTLSSGVLTFPSAAEGRNVDLLYASSTNYARNSTESAVLTFKHALARISFGTLTNNTGAAISITGISVSGTLHSSGDLNLSTGIWAPDAGSSLTYTRYPGSPIAVADKETVSANQDACLLIPDANGKITVTITITLSGGETFTFDTELEQGLDKTYNIIIEKNFEVVIVNSE